MTQKMYWMRLPADGTFAQIEGSAERDRMAPLGWEVADSPGDTDFVWMRHEGIAEPARLPWASRSYWEAQKWVASGPPTPVDPTKDPAFVDQPKPVWAPDSTDTSTASGKSATATDKKTKE